MLDIRPLEAANAPRIVAWCAGTDADFLRQWAGDGYVHPITEAQIAARLAGGEAIFEIDRDGVMVGTVELIRRDGDSAHMGRFLIDPSLAGRGLGAQALTAFMAYCRSRLALSGLTLNVFDFNLPARRCYDKCGFAQTACAAHPSGWTIVSMQARL